VPKAKAALVTIRPSAQLVQARTKGLTLTSPLAPLVKALVVKDSESYLEADLLLGRVANARAVWKTKIDPIAGPLKAALDNAKLAMEGVKNLDKEVDGPLELMEGAVKKAMKDYKLLEAAQIQEQKRLEDEEARKLREAAAAKEAAASTAKTSQMRARLEQARADLEAQAVVKEQQATANAATVVKGGASSDRWVEKAKIKDLHALLTAMEVYEPANDIYRKGVPPLSLITVEMLQVAVNKVYASQPGIVATWPGIVIEKDVIIARR